MHRVDRERRSAKKIIEAYARELLCRRNDPDVKTKLLAIETIAFRMGWNDLYNDLRFKFGLHKEEVQVEKWWQR